MDDDGGQPETALAPAGLGPLDEQAYRLLVQLARAHPADLAERMAVTRERAVTLLEALRLKGLAAIEHDDEQTYRALPPEVALGPTLLHRQASIEAARQAVAQLAEMYRTNARRHDSSQLVEVVAGGHALRERIRLLQDTARTEMLWFCKANPVAMSSAENTEEFSALDRGVRYRVIYERALLDEPGMLDSVAEGIRRGEEARMLPQLPVRLAVADGSTALCPLVPFIESGRDEPTAAVIGRSQLLDALMALFESYWDRATPVRLSADGTTGERADPARVGPDEDERYLLSLLVAGVPDKSIASQLCVSRRTVQRRVERLMALADVDTRPGLAYQAARRGWI
ncbi:helix-turn-helix domain-containing protein [Micromonospora sp. NPDC050200]|uniref:helix-turn-helix domain-containing protein n=1 Tax=Micromonospora sp. NPDC050200 TaxID=3155664 RepID=UPI003411F07E